jgi:predicted transcriptional regulator
MSRNVYNPRAYLTTMKNVRAGLASRTKVLSSMERGAGTIAEISEKSRISYACAAHHLRLLMKERIVTRSGTKRGYFWALTKFGQQSLMR